MRTVKNILESKAKAFNTVSPNTLVIDALKLMTTVNLSYLVVMDGDVFKGIFSERDYSRNVILKGRASNNTTVQEVMSTDSPLVSLDDTVEQCMNFINIYKTRYLVAYDNDEKFHGVITIHDLLRQVIANKENVFDHSIAQQLIDEAERSEIY